MGRKYEDRGISSLRRKLPTLPFLYWIGEKRNGGNDEEMADRWSEMRITVDAAKREGSDKGPLRAKGRSQTASHAASKAEYRSLPALEKGGEGVTDEPAAREPWNVNTRERTKIEQNPSIAPQEGKAGSESRKRQDAKQPNSAKLGVLAERQMQPTESKSLER